MASYAAYQHTPLVKSMKIIASSPKLVLPIICPAITELLTCKVCLHAILANSHTYNLIAVEVAGCSFY